MDDRVSRERSFHNRSYAEGGRRRASGFYSAARGAFAHYRELIDRYGEGASVLEYGCGRGGSAWRLRNRAATVVGIDISDEAVRIARDRHADAPGCAKRRFERMDAETLEFPDATFDLVCGTAILHHLDLDRASSEVARVLRPGGRAVFLEPLGHNLLINLYRRLTPAIRTVDEHPLLMPDLEELASGFDSADHRFFALASLTTLPFRRLGVFDRMERQSERCDAWLFRHLRFLRRYAWIVVSDYASAAADDPSPR